MNQQILANQLISIHEHLQQEGNKNEEIFTDTKMENIRTMKDQDFGFEVDDEERQNIRKQALQSEKEILEEKLKRITEELGASHHDDSDSCKMRCHGEVVHQINQNDSSTEPTANDKDTTICPIPTETDSHGIKQEDINTAMDNKPIEGATSSYLQCSHDTDLKTVYSEYSKDEVEEETIDEIIPVHHQRGLMSKADSWKIQRHTDFLVNELDAIELINILYSQFVFDDDDYELLLNTLETKGRYRCITNMLIMLRRNCGPNSYIHFLVALERCGYTWIITTLEPGCGIYKGKIKYSGQKFYELIDNTSPKYKEFVKRCENNIEQVYWDQPGQQFVVVKKLEKGCVEVIFHLISLGSNDDEGLRSCLHDVVQSGLIDSDPVKSDSFTFHRITDEEISTARQTMKEKQVKDLENEIKTLKSEIIDLKVENDALKSESVHSTEIQTFKEHETNTYTEKLQELELKKGVVIWCSREKLNQAKQDNDKLQEDLGRLQQLNRYKADLHKSQTHPIGTHCCGSIALPAKVEYVKGRGGSDSDCSTPSPDQVDLLQSVTLLSDLEKRQLTKVKLYRHRRQHERCCVVC